MTTEQKFKTVYDMHKIFLKDIDDPQRAIRLLGLSDAVIEKFGDQITKDDVLAQVRKAILGPARAADTPLEGDSKIVKEAILHTVSWLMTTTTVDSQGWLFHENDAVRSFGRRMYLELNPDGCTADQLDGMRQEWGMEMP